MDHLAKTTILEAPSNHIKQTKCFSLKPVCVLLGRNKVTSNKGERVRFWVQQQLARVRFHDAKFLIAHQFDLVDWDMVYMALCWVPRMFQIWACKQVMDIAPANGNCPW